MHQTIYTVGHGTLEIERFRALLEGFVIAEMVDVRRFPHSTRHPQFGRDALAAALREARIGYRWDERLGGRRAAPKGAARDTALRNSAFRNYAAHMRTAEFGAAIAALLGAPGAPATALLCSESLWWRCHRRLIADFLTVARDCSVEHLMHDGKARPHVPTEGARREGDGVVYDQGMLELGVMATPAPRSKER